MNFGEILIYLNPLLVISAIYFGYNNIKHKDKSNNKNFDTLLYVILSNHTLLLILLAYYFLKTDLRFEYVSDYSSDELSIGYKLAGVWAGRDGTLLIWTWATTLTLVLERFFHKVKGLQRDLTSIIGTILLLSLCIIQLYINPFEMNEIVPDNGNSLNILLLSPYMIIHPPIVFVSYGMIALLYASAMAFLITEDKSWNGTIKRWGRGSWIGMSLALIIGGYWAYVTLGWGGYWAWDPVETSGLLPWLTMTSLLHASVMSRRKKDYRILGPLLAMFTFVLVLLESFVTRGGIWISFHAFLPSQSDSVTQRFFDVMEADKSVMNFFILMVISIILTLAIVIKKYRDRKDEDKQIEYDSIEKIFSEDNTFFAAIYTQLLILTVTLVLLLVSAKGQLTPEIYEMRLAPFVVLLAAIFTIHTLRPFFELKKILLVVGFAIIFSAIYAFMIKGNGWMVGAMLPWAFVCGFSIFRYMWKYRNKKLLPMIRAWGPYTAHLGIMLILIGYCISYGLDTKDTVTLAEGEEKIVGNFVLELSEISTENSGTEIQRIANIQLKENDGEELVVDDQISISIQGEQETTNIYLKHELHRDLYITLDEVPPGIDGELTAKITVREIPGIILVWTGAFLTILGMIITMFTEWKPGQKWLRNISKKVPDH